MASVLVLVALVGQSLSAPLASIAVESADVMVTVLPRDRRTIETITLQPHPPKGKGQMPAPVAPHTREALPKRGLRVFFDRPRTRFHVVITFDDESVHRVEYGRNTYLIVPTHRDLLPPKPAQGD